MNKRVFIVGYGCCSNIALTRTIEVLLSETGFEIVNSLDKADFAVMNTCTVKTETEQRMLSKIKELSSHCHTVVTGCMANAQAGVLRVNFPDISIVSPSLLQLISQILSSPTPVTIINVGGLPPLHPKVVNGRLIVPIARGCLGNCSYCIVKKALGNLRSYPPDYIINCIRNSIAENPSEIFITAQDVAVYGRDLQTDVNLVDLVNEILNMEGKFMVRLGMMTPNRVSVIKERLLDLLKNERVYKFLHMPLQSGDDDILKSMGRQYDSKSFIELANFFRSKIPDLTLVTDVIVGFPEEDNYAFKRTIEVIDSVKPDKVNISRFTPRPHTIANLMPQVPDRVKASRSREMTKICRKISVERRKMFVGSTTKVITLKSKGSTFYGKTHSFVPILLEATVGTKTGEFYRTYISGLSVIGFKGVILGPYLSPKSV